MYFALKGEIARQTKRNRRLESMLMRMREPAARDSPPVVEPALTDRPAFQPSSPRPGMNLNRRVQALRLLRRGENLGFIAAALGVPKREVELTVRVHQLTMAASAGAASAGAASAGADRAQRLGSQPVSKPVRKPVLQGGPPVGPTTASQAGSQVVPHP